MLLVAQEKKRPRHLLEATPFAALLAENVANTIPNNQRQPFHGHPPMNAQRSATRRLESPVPITFEPLFALSTVDN